MPLPVSPGFRAPGTPGHTFDEEDEEEKPPGRSVRPATASPTGSSPFLDDEVEEDEDGEEDETQYVDFDDL
jgi:hypothetical protein